MTRLLISVVCVGALLLLGADAPAGKVVYFNDFEKSSPGKVPDDFLVVGGDFAIAEAGGKKFLQLPGAPLDYFGLLFGPADFAEVEVSASIWSDRTGNRLPEFGIGAGDVGGPRLWVVPAQHVIQIRKGDDVLATADSDWTPGMWVTLKLKIVKSAAGGASISGVVRPVDAGARTAAIEAHDTDAPAPGHASAWGAPYSDQPIRFGDLKVSTLK